jgi:5-formyltetrahydrofolate cyclo-ligase
MPPSAHAEPPNLPEFSSTHAHDEIALEKATLRKILRARRADAAAGDDGSQHPPIAPLLLARNFPKKLYPRMSGTVISGYMPLKDEIDPFDILGEARSRRMFISMPRTPPKGSGLPLTFHHCKLRDTGWETVFETSAFGVREPPASCAEMPPNLMIVPLLGFDRQGRRLGYGAGHYDRTIAALRASLATSSFPLVAVGVAWACQEVDRIPTDATDQQLDWVVTDKEAIGPFPRPPA